MENETREISLRDIFKVFVPKIWLIVLVGIIAAGATFGYCKYVKKDTYTAEATIFVVSRRGTGTSTSYELVMAQQAIVDYSEVIVKRNFLGMVEDELKNKYSCSTSVDELMSIVKTEVVEGSMMIDVTVRSGNKELAYYTAEAICYLIGDEPKVLNQILSYSTDIKIVENPRPINEMGPDAKYAARNAAIAFVAGVLVMMLIVYLIHLCDVIIRDKEKFEANFDIPVLGVIPIVTFTQVRKEEVSE